MNSEILNGAGNDFRHQVIISHIIYGLMDKFKKVKKYNNYIPLPELSLKPENSQIPDITVYKTLKNEPSSPIVLIEICWSNRIKDEILKLTTLMINIPSIEEAFIIDKENLEIKRIYRTKSKARKPSLPQKSSKVETFNVDLTNFFDKVAIR